MIVHVPEWVTYGFGIFFHVWAVQRTVRWIEYVEKN